LNSIAEQVYYKAVSVRVEPDEIDTKMHTIFLNIIILQGLLKA